MTTIAAGDMRHMDNDKATPVQTIMTPLPIETANPSTNVYDLAKQMKEKSKGAVIILDNQKGDTAGRPAGIITERDIVRKVVAGDNDPRKTLASEIMSKPLISVGEEASIYDAALIMTKYTIRRLPIVRDNLLLGIITATDLARRIYEKNKEDPVLKAMSRFSLLERLQ
jgi:CBS domain-containing protein